MDVPLPFKISRAAEEHILAQPIEKLPSGFEPGLRLCFAYESRSPAGELMEKFHGEHFTISGDSPEQWTSALSSVKGLIAGRALWIPLEVLRVLRGKTLTARPREVGYGKHAGTMRDLLVVD